MAVVLARPATCNHVSHQRHREFGIETQVESRSISRPTTRLLPEPGLRASSPPGPMLLLRDLFRPPFPAKELATSTVMFSLSILLRTGDCPVDLRGRRVEGTVASVLLDMMAAVKRHSFCQRNPRKCNVLSYSRLADSNAHENTR